MITIIVQGMIPSSDSNEEIFTKLEARVKPLVGGIIELHDDVDDKGDGPSRWSKVLLNPLSMELGAEMFMGLVNLSEGSTDANAVHGSVSSERAWILTRH